MKMIYVYIYIHTYSTLYIVYTVCVCVCVCVYIHPVREEKEERRENTHMQNIDLYNIKY